jgi:iron complex outermembrane receptor protein
MGAVRNLFDADAREPTPAPSASLSIPNDLPLPGRSLYVQAVYSM